MDLSRIFSIRSEEEFQEAAIAQFQFQIKHNETYRRFCELMKINPERINSLLEIPFLPIETFKSHKIYCGNEPHQAVFTSSGTTGQTPSRHYVRDMEWYDKSFASCFQLFYGNSDEYCFLFLLPSYLERSGSSLVYMATQLVAASKNKYSGFFLYDLDALIERIAIIKSLGQKTILFGVTYALLDLAEKGVELNEQFIVMETGGMKGKRAEWPKAQLHDYLKNKLCIHKIHSEYGMTELLSQAYCTGDGWYKCPPWMKVIIRDSYSPQEYLPPHKTGGINVIDLANFFSCSFIATQDAGRLKGEGNFEVLGRLTDAELRGCNLMMD